MVKLRRAEMSDWARLFSWRNEPTTVAASKAGKIALEDHMAWIAAVLDDEDRALFVARDETQSLTVGTGRLDYQSGNGKKNVPPTVEFSLTVDHRYRGAGYATAIVAGLVSESLNIWGTDAVMGADVKVANAASLRAFAENGFWPKAYTGGLVRLERR